MTLLDRPAIVELLTALGRQLDQRGSRGHLFLVGGRAMALAHDTRRSTRDLDGVFEPVDVVRDAAAVVADEHGLAPDWLNDAVKGFLPGADPDATTLLEVPGLTVRVASPRYLFAMKAAAARIARDADDLRTLYRLCGFASVAEALDCVEGYYPAHLLPPRTSFLVNELLGGS